MTLTNRFSVEKANKELKKKERTTTFVKIRDMFIHLLNSTSMDHNTSNLEEFLDYFKGGDQGDETTKALIEKIEEGLSQLEKKKSMGRQEICEKIMKDIEIHVTSESNNRILRKNIIMRLRRGLENLHKNQKFMKEQMESYNTYLDVARQQQAVKKKKKKSTGKSIKFSYSRLSKSGAIISSSVPEKSRKHTTFTIESGDNLNEFFVKAKIGGVTVDTVTVVLDDLLEKQSQSIEHWVLDNVTLDVNMTIHLLNRHFLK